MGACNATAGGTRIVDTHEDDGGELMEMFRSNDTEKGRELLKSWMDEDHDPNTVYKNGVSALMMAAWVGDWVVTTNLVQGSAPIDLQDQWGETALSYAARGADLTTWLP